MKKDLKKLRQQRADAATKGKAALVELNTLQGKADPTEADQAKLSALEAQVDELEASVTALDAEIAAEEKAAKRAALFSTSAATASVPARAFSSSEPNPETTGGYHSLAEFAVSVRSALTGGAVDQRLLAATPTGTMQNQGGANEGFLVPTQFREQIWEIAFDPNDLLGLVTMEPTTSNVVALPKDETTPWGASGVQARWRSENTQMSPSAAQPTGAMVQLNELYAFVVASSELLEDAPRLNDRLTRRAGQAIRWKASDAIMWGDGNGKPLGFMNAGALVTVAKESGQAAGTIATANVLKMYSRLLRTGGRPIWLANSDTLPQLGALTLGQQPAWLPSSAPLQGTPDGTLLGRPMLFTEHSQTLSTAGDIVVADLEGYYAITKAGGGIDFAASIHLFFDYNASAFRWTFRMGGQPFLSAPVSPANGTNTKSHFVALQAR